LPSLLVDWALAEHQIPDSQSGSCPTKNTNQAFCILRHILATVKKEKNEGIYWFSGPLCCLIQCSKRETLETLANNEDSPVFERYHSNHVYRMPILPSHWWRQIFWGGCAQQRLVTGLPSEALTVLIFITMTWIDSWLYRGAATALDSV